MEVHLPPEIERLVLEKVRSGVYANTSDLIGDAVRQLLETSNPAHEMPLKPDARSEQLAREAPVNLQWLAENRTVYEGEWVALHKGTLIAHGENGLDVYKAAIAQGINPPLMHRVAMEPEAYWGGW